MKLELLTNSRSRSARACMREHQLRYDLGFRPVTEAEVLRFGSLCHLGLEAWALAIKAGAPQNEWLGHALAAMEGEADPFERAKAEAMLTGYHIRWADEPYEILAVEARFEMPLINPATGASSRTWRLGGKIDLIVRDLRDGRVLVEEHKTSAEDVGQGSSYWKRLRMDGQVSIYLDGAKALGFDVAGCLYDVLGKPGQRPLKATPVEERKYTKPTKAEPTPRLYANQRAEDETPAEYRHRILEAIAADPAAHYQRGEVVRLESELEEARYDIWQTAQAVQHARLAGRAPRNPDACVRYGQTCPFFSVCTGEASLEDPLLFRRLENPHVELTEAA